MCVALGFRGRLRKVSSADGRRDNRCGGPRRNIRGGPPSLRGRGLRCDYVTYFFVLSREVYLHCVTNMYLVIYFFMPSREVYLHDVTNMYLVIYRFVWRLTFDCAQMCFPKRHPPMRGRGYMRLFVCSSSPASCVSCFAKRHPPSLDFRG